MGNAYLVVAEVLFVVVALAWPTWRVRRRFGAWPIVFARNAQRGQRFAGVLFAVLMLGVFAWTMLLALGHGELIGTRAPPVWLAVSGWVAMIGGTALTVSAQRGMGAAWRIGIDERPTELITGGVFAFSRNPIFSGMLVALFGMVLVAPGPWSVGGWLATAAVISWQVRNEERHLARVHARAYASYAARVGRFVPLLGRLN